MKQIIQTTIPLLCAALAPLCADAQGTQDKDKAAAKQQQQQYMDEMNKITPSGEPSVARWADPYLTADFIWWRAVEDGLDYGYSGVSPTPGVNATKGRVQHPHFSYEPGFKVGFGLKFRHDGWDFFSQYTRLNFDRGDSKNRINTSASGTSNVSSNIAMPYADGIQTTFFADSASSNWSLNFNVLDLELGRNFWVSKWLTMRPFVGMKLDWTTQHYNPTYNDVTTSDLTDALIDLDGGDVAMRMRQKQFGVGLRSGLNTTWYMWKKWCIFGELALSGMLNHFKANRTDTVTPLVGASWTQNSFKRTTHPVTAVMEWSLGLRYETAFHNDDYMFQFQAGWEDQIWFNQNQFVFFPNASNGQNLSFQGLTIKAAFYF